MKLFFATFVLSIVLLMGSCYNQNMESETKEDIAAIEDLLENYILANENQDFDLIKRIWAPDEDIILYGTDSDERLMGWTNIETAIKEQFGYITDTYISASNQFIKLNNTCNTAWFAETLNYNYMYNGEAHSYEGLRFTGIVEKIDENWVLVQAHLSVPASVGIGDK